MKQGTSRSAYVEAPCLCSSQLPVACHSAESEVSPISLESQLPISYCQKTQQHNLLLPAPNCNKDKVDKNQQEGGRQSWYQRLRQ